MRMMNLRSNRQETTESLIQLIGTRQYRIKSSDEPIYFFSSVLWSSHSSRCWSGIAIISHIYSIELKSLLNKNRDFRTNVSYSIDWKICIYIVKIIIMILLLLYFSSLWFMTVFSFYAHQSIGISAKRKNFYWWAMYIWYI